jgi:hypothetical protein
MHLREFIEAGGVFIGSNSSAEFAIANFTYGVSLNRPGTSSRVVGSLLRTKLVDQASPIVYGVPDNLAMYSDSGESFSVSPNVGGGRGAGAGRRARPAEAGAADRMDGPRDVEHPTIRTSSRGDLQSRDRTCRRSRRRSPCSHGNMRCPPRTR